MKKLALCLSLLIMGAIGSAVAFQDDLPTVAAADAKAIEKMRLAEKFHIPIVTLVNTPGAFPGIAAEEHGQAFIIAKNLFDMSKLRTPIVSVVIGESLPSGLRARRSRAAAAAGTWAR